MARKFLSTVDFTKVPTNNLVFQSSASDLSSPVAGLIYYNTSTNKFLVYNGSAFYDPTNRATHTGTQTSSTISDLATVVKAYTLDSFAAPVAAVSMNSQRLTNVAAPTTSTDAANQSYVDTAVQSAAAGIISKPAVNVVSTTNQSTISGFLVIDGVTTTAGMRVLLTGQTTTSQNGVYIAASGAWSRPSGDADANDDLALGGTYFVEAGTTYASSTWRLATPTSGTITPGTTNITFTQLTAAATYTASLGVALSGNNIQAAYGAGLTLSGNNLIVDTTVVARKYAVAVGDGSSTSITVTHNLGTTNIEVTLRDTSGNQLEVDNQAATTNTVVLTFAVAPTASQYTCIVIG
jgi:hypothetical protein